MKEKYEKPKIESEAFALEMMQAACDNNDSNIHYSALYDSYPSYGVTCGCIHNRSTQS